MSRKATTDQPTNGRARVVAVVNQKGGVGKTTITLALAAAAREAKGRVAVLDLDPQASASLWSMRRQKMLGFADPDFTVRPIPAQPEIVASEIDRLSAEGFGWVFIDTAPSANGATTDLVQLTDVVLVPVGDGAFDLTATAPTIDVVKAGGRSPIIVFNRVPANARRAMNEMAETFRRVKEGIAVGPRIGSRAEIKHAQLAARTIGEFGPESRAQAEVKELLKYVLACFAEPAPAVKQREAAHV